MALFRKKIVPRAPDAPVQEWPPQAPPTDAPELLKLLWPLVLRWGVGDDADRARIVDEASSIELQSLVERVGPALSVIDAYLEATAAAEHAVPYGDLAQATIEARFELERRARHA